MQLWSSGVERKWTMTMSMSMPDVIDLNNANIFTFCTMDSPAHSLPSTDYGLRIRNVAGHLIIVTVD